MAKVNFWERTSLNATTNIIRTLAMALIGLYLIPFYLDELGMAAYGIIPLATTLSSYIMIVSDSLTSACNRYTTLAIRRSDREACESLSTAIFGIGRICLIIVPLALAVSYFSPALFDLSGTSYGDVQAMFSLIFLSSLIVSVGSGLNSVFFAYNNLYLMYIARLIYSVSQVGMIFVLFSLTDPTLAEVGISYLISSVLLVCFLAFFSKKSNPRLKVRYSYYDRALFRKMGELGFWAILSRVGGLLYIEVSMILVNIYLGAETQAGFAIVSTVISMASTACLSVSVVLEPLYYRYYEEGKEAELRHILCVGMKLIGLIMVLPIAFVIVYSDAILTAWVGAEYVYLGQLLFIAMVGDLAYVISIILNDIPILYLKNQYSVMVILFFGIINSVLTFFVVSVTDWGAEVAMAAWSISIVGQSLGLLFLVIRITHAPLRSFVKPIVVCYISLIICYVILSFLNRTFELPGSWLYVIPWFLALFVVYSFVALRFFTGADEKEMIVTMFPGKIKSVLHKMLY